MDGASRQRMRGGNGFAALTRLYPFFDFDLKYENHYTMRLEGAPARNRGCNPRLRAHRTPRLEGAPVPG